MQLGTFAEQTTTNSFVDLGVAWDKRGTTGSAVIVVTNTGGSNGVSYQVLGSVDGVTFVTVANSANLAASTSAAVIVSDPWPYLKVQVKAQVGGSQTTVKAAASAHAG